MCTACQNDFGPDSPPDDPVLALIIAILRAMSRPDRNAILAFLAFWRELSWEDRAIFASTVKPDLTEDEVATLAAVSRRHLYRGERYQAHKQRLADFKEA